MFIAASLLWLIACLWFPLTDTDIWWHLASAKLMVSAKAFLRADPFCQSSLGAPWADLHWGFQLLAYALWKLGGARALVMGKCFALAGALGCSLKPHLDRRTVPWLLPLAAFGLYHIRFFIDVRPLALTLLGLGIQYATVTAHLRGQLSRPWRILLPVQVAMVNIQGLYPLGPLLVSCLAAGEYAGRRWPALFSTVGMGMGTDFGTGKVPDLRSAQPSDRNRLGDSLRGSAPSLRPLYVTCAVLWSAGLLSPYGWRGFALPLSLLGRIAPMASNIFSSEIAENLPLSDLLRRDPGAALPFLFLGLAAALTFAFARPRLSLGHALLFLAFAALGGMAQRNLPLSLLAALMAAGHNLQVTLGRRYRDHGRNPALWAGWLSLSLIAFLYGPKLRAAWEYELPGSLETPFRFPSPAVDYLERHPVPGNIFNELRYGGYLEFRLFPGARAFVDGRMILRSADFYRDFLRAADHPGRFPEYRARYGFTHALLPISEDQRFLPLAAWLIREGGWSLLYCDGAAALLADTAFAGSAAGMPLDSLPPEHPLRRELGNRFDANPRLRALAIGNAVAFLQAAGRDRAAADLLRP